MDDLHRPELDFTPSGVGNRGSAITDCPLCGSAVYSNQLPDHLGNDCTGGLAE